MVRGSVRRIAALVGAGVVMVLSGGALYVGRRAADSPGDTHCPSTAETSSLSGHGFNVVFDQSYWQTASPFDTGFAGMSILATALRNDGATVSVNSVPLVSLLRSFRGAGNVLVLGVPALRVEYTNQDLAAIDAFLATGGGVLTIVEHDNIYGNADFQSKLLRRHDIRVMPQNALGSGTSYQDRFWPWAEASCGLGKMRPFYSACLKPDGRASSLTSIARPLRAECAVSGAINSTGRGRFVAIGDYEFLWNMAPPFGITLGENLTFALRMFRMLAQTTGEVASANPAPVSPRSVPPRGAVLFSTLASALGPDASPSGLSRFAAELDRAGYRIAFETGEKPDYAKYDLVVLACPTSAIPEASPLTLAKRLLVAGDGLSSVTTDPDWRAVLSQVETVFHVRLTAEEQDYPLNRLLRPFGFEFAGETLIARGAGNPLHVRARWLDGGEEFLLRRATWISWEGPSPTSDLTVLAEAVAPSWGKKSLLPVQELGKVSAHYDTRSDGNGRMPVIVSSERVFALADVDLLTNQLADTLEAAQLRRRVLSWLEKATDVGARAGHTVSGETTPTPSR